MGFSAKLLQSAARTPCAPWAHKAHTNGLRCIFCQVHAPAENDLILFADYRRQTLRGFFDRLIFPALRGGEYSVRGSNRRLESNPTTKYLHFAAAGIILMARALKKMKRRNEKWSKFISVSGLRSFAGSGA